MQLYILKFQQFLLFSNNKTVRYYDAKALRTKYEGGFESMRTTIKVGSVFDVRKMPSETKEKEGRCAAN